MDFANHGNKFAVNQRIGWVMFWWKCNDKNQHPVSLVKCRVFLFFLCEVSCNGRFKWMDGNMNVNNGWWFLAYEHVLFHQFGMDIYEPSGVPRRILSFWLTKNRLAQFFSPAGPAFFNVKQPVHSLFNSLHFAVQKTTVFFATWQPLNKIHHQLWFNDFPNETTISFQEIPIETLKKSH